MIVRGDMEKDLFESTLLITEKTMECVLETLNKSVWDFSEMSELYRLLSAYDALCSDLKLCKTEYAKSLIRNQLEELSRRIHRFYVVNIQC